MINFSKNIASISNPKLKLKTLFWMQKCWRLFSTICKKYTAVAKVFKSNYSANEIFCAENLSNEPGKIPIWGIITFFTEKSALSQRSQGN